MNLKQENQQLKKNIDKMFSKEQVEGMVLGLKNEIERLNKENPIEWKEHAIYQRNWRIRLQKENEKLKKEIERLKKQSFMNVLCSPNGKDLKTYAEKLEEKDKEIENARLREIDGCNHYNELNEENQQLKQQLKQIEEGSLIPEIYIDDLNELSRLREQRKKIEDRIKIYETSLKNHLDNIHELNIVHDVKSCRNCFGYNDLIEELKSLLESEKDDNQHQAERDSHKSVDVGSYPSENPRGEQTLQHFG